MRTRYLPGPCRDLLFVGLILAMSYAVAFMETLTIAHFPYYDFEDRDMAYTVGSAFYGLYFVVSFPAFLRVDEAPAGAVGAQTHTLARAAVEALAAAMAVLQLLDFVRLALGIPLVIRSAPG